jgi:photosystem II stability/assembly factor-like uncharacterized protein
VWINGGIRNYYWHNVGGGDGFDVMADPENASWVYSESQGGSFGKRNWQTGESWYIKPPATDPSVKMRFNWNTPMAQDPFDSKTIYLGSQFVHKSTDKGASWQMISTDLTTNDSVKIKAFQNTGGLTLDITGAETHCSLLSIAPSAKEKGVIWVSSDDGQVHLTRDGGQTWTSFAGKIPGLPVGAWVPQVTASRHNAAEAFVVANDYRRGDFKPYIFRTTDFGKTWTRLVDETKVNGYALCMIQDPTEPNLIFVGTEHGLWISVDNGTNFSQWKNGFPSVSTYDLAIQEREADLAIATFGRALWILDDIRPLRKLAASSTKTPVNNITLFPAPDAVQAQYKPADGFEWSVMGIWDADNRPRGAVISFYINKPKKADTATTKPVAPAAENTVASQAPPMGGGGGRGAGGGGRGFSGGRGFGGGNRGDSVNVRIFNAERQLIRSLRWNVDTGFNRLYWGMEEKGYRMPGSPKPQPGAQEPGGAQVLPGTYKIVMTYAGQMDSTTIQIKDDPRLGNRNEIKLAQRNALERIRKAGTKLTEGMDRLTEAEEVCNKMVAQLKGVEGKPADSLRKASNAILDEIKKIRESINGKTSDKQGITRSPFEVTVMTQLQNAMQSINAKMMAPGAQEEKLIQNAEEAIRKTVTEINTLFSSKWVDYRKQVEETKVNLFKEYSPISE